MKVVALYTDFRIYWPARLSALGGALVNRGDTLDVIEIAGKGSPYSFAEQASGSDIPWHILFPESKPEELSGEYIKAALFKLLDDINPDVIISGAIAFPSGALAAQWCLMHDKRHIVFDDSKMAAVKRSGIVNFVKQSVYDEVDAMLYPAPDWKDTGHFWGFDDDRMYFGVDVVDNDFWSECSQKREIDGNYFVCVGRQIEKKHYDYIIDAFSKFSADVPDNDYRLVLIGEGPEHQKLVRMANSLGIQDKVLFLPFKSQKELRGIYQHACALITCSEETETWGLTINEAMAGRCPIIASVECGATNTLVHPGKNGFSFSYKNIDELASLMHKFYRLDAKQKVNMGLKSSEIISNWGLPRFVSGSIDAIDFVISHKKRKPSLLRGQLLKRWNGRYNPI